MASISLNHIKKVYPGDIEVISDLNLQIKDKEFVVLVGPSGCGKSTTLRMIAGLEEISDGEMYIGDRKVNDVAPKDRDIAMVFQNYALYPHMTVYKNMAFALKLRKTPKDEIDRKVHEAAKVLDIEHLLNRKPKQLSGGQRQRVALGRAMVRDPAVFLLDEPLSNLDAKLRSQLRTDLIELHNRLGSTFVYVTHDQVEAMSMGTQIVLMNKGKIMQCGTPHTIYHDPDNVFTAQFIGTPPMNILKQNQVHYEHLPVENACYLGFRPEYVTFYEDVPDEKQKGLIIDGKVITHEMLGIETLYKIDTCYGRIQAKIFDDKKAVDGNVKMFIPHNRILYFDEEEQRIR